MDDKVPQQMKRWGSEKGGGGKRKKKKCVSIKR